MKKKREIQKAALEAGLRVLNPRQAPAIEEGPAEEVEEADGDE
jgi:hypothetical protein